ncbi:hypothetical protein ANO11243_047270 [Dothideomycetidae sp. 11243]|nr:hypothetical protein ANO11243_047270 [fungal sp. No.11243]
MCSPTDLRSDSSTSVFLLEHIPSVLTHRDLAEVNILISDDGHVTGVVDFDHAGLEAFGMSIWCVFECFLGGMTDGKFPFFDQLVGSDSARTVRDVLEETFWQALWSAVPQQLSKARHERSVRLALAIGVMDRYLFNSG